MLGVKAQKYRVKMVRSIKEGLEGVREIRFTNSASYFINRLGEALHVVFNIQKSILVLQQALPSFVELLAITGLVSLCICICEGRVQKELFLS